MIALTFYWCNIGNKVVFLLTIINKLQDNDPFDLWSLKITRKISLQQWVDTHTVGWDVISKYWLTLRPVRSCIRINVNIKYVSFMIFCFIHIVQCSVWLSLRYQLENNGIKLFIQEYYTKNQSSTMSRHPYCRVGCDK
jgi:hypothetical protein